MRWSSAAVLITAILSITGIVMTNPELLQTIGTLIGVVVLFVLALLLMTIAP